MKYFAFPLTIALICFVDCLEGLNTSETSLSNDKKQLKTEVTTIKGLNTSETSLSNDKKQLKTEVSTVKDSSNDDPSINGITVPAPVTKIDPPGNGTAKNGTAKENGSAKPITSPITPVTNGTSPKPITTSTTPTPSTSTTTKKSTTTEPTTTNKPAPTTEIPSPPAPSPSPTMAPVTTTTSPHHDRKFDGPSFVGGIILALGLVAIGFVAFKFYKARTELNYHTL